MKEYLESYEDVLKEQKSSEEGLTSAEAEKRLAQVGRNRLEEGKKDFAKTKFTGLDKKHMSMLYYPCRRKCS